MSGSWKLCDRLGVVGALDAAVGPVKQRKRGFGAGELLTGIAAAQLAGEEFLVGLDRQCEDAAGQQLVARYRDEGDVAFEARSRTSPGSSPIE